MIGYVEVSGQWLDRLCDLAEARIKNRHEADVKALKDKAVTPTSWWGRLWDTSEEALRKEVWWEDQALLTRMQKLELLRASTLCSTVHLSLETFQWIHGWAGKPESEPLP